MGGRDISNTENRVTFSGLLNAIDGVAGQEGKLLFMTTNYVDRLDEALLRPGRVDFQALFGLATQDAIRRLFLRFYRVEKSSPVEGEEEKIKFRKGKVLPQEELEALASQFSSQVPNGTYSMAKIQGHMMKYRHDPNEALANIHTLSSAEPTPGVGNGLSAGLPQGEEGKMLDFDMGESGPGSPPPRESRGKGRGKMRQRSTAAFSDDAH